MSPYRRGMGCRGAAKCIPCDTSHKRLIHRFPANDIAAPVQMQCNLFPHLLTKPLSTGGNIYSSSNVRTGIRRLEQREEENTGIGDRGEGRQIYAPHGYDSVVDSDRYENFYSRLLLP